MERQGTGWHRTRWCRSSIICLIVWIINPKVVAAGARQPYTPHPSIHPPFIMANTTNTPKHTDPATKRDEKKNETEVKDKVSGKTKTTQKK